MSDKYNEKEIAAVVRVAFLVAKRGFHREAQIILKESGYENADFKSIPGIVQSEIQEIFRKSSSETIEKALAESNKDPKAMKRYFYYLSVLTPPKSAYDSGDWDRIWYDYVEATDKKSAIKIIENDLDAIVKQKVIVRRPQLVDGNIVPSEKKATKADYKIFITDPDEYWDDHWLRIRTCTECKSPYTMLQVKQTGTWCSTSHCSEECNRAGKPTITFDDYNRNGFGNGKPCIYKITNKVTGMVYIGQTTQVYTLRWYQHTFQPTKTKFHVAMEASRPEDWTYEVLEIFSFKEGTKEKLREREHHWVKHFDSINNGYNSATVIAEDKKREDLQEEFKMDKGA